MKNLVNSEIKNLFLVIFFATIFFVGVGSFKDYGISSDEPNSRLKGLVTANYLGEKFFPKITENYKKKFSIETNKDYKIGDLHEKSKIKYYGVVFEFPAFLIERIFEVNVRHKQYQLKHFLTFLVFFVSLISFYKLLNLRFQNWIIGILGVTILVLSPRIFANSFYNNKDLIFLSFFIFSIHASLIFINKQSFKSLVFSSLFCALAIDVRIIGIITPIILLITLSIKHFLYNKKIKSLLILTTQYLIFLFLFVVIFWPYLWSDPINNFIEAYNTMSKYPHITHNLFLGKYVLSTEIPKIYLLIWIIITTPPVYILFFFIGLLIFLLNFIKNKDERFNQNFFNDFFCCSILFLVPFMIIYLGSTLYSGWRQLYFLYVVIIYFSIFGIYQTYLFINKNYKKYFICFFILTFIFVSNWMIVNHPHQYVYFNFLAGKNFDKKFDMDYWGLSYKENLEFLIKNEKKESFKIFNLSQNKMYIHSIILPFDDLKKLKFVDNPLDADYLITNHYYEKEPKYYFPENNFRVFNDIVIDGVSINTLYKKID
jgi:hypothetical protein